MKIDSNRVLSYCGLRTGLQWLFFNHFCTMPLLPGMLLDPPLFALTSMSYSISEEKYQENKKISISITRLVAFKTFATVDSSQQGKSLKQPSLVLFSMSLHWCFSDKALSPSNIVSRGIRFENLPRGPIQSEKAEKERNKTNHTSTASKCLGVAKVPDQSNISRSLLPNCKAVLPSQLKSCFLNCKIPIFQSVLFSLKVSYTR